MIYCMTHVFFLHICGTNSSISHTSCWIFIIVLEYTHFFVEFCRDRRLRAFVKSLPVVCFPCRASFFLSLFEPKSEWHSCLYISTSPSTCPNLHPTFWPNELEPLHSCYSRAREHAIALVPTNYIGDRDCTAHACFSGWTHYWTAIWELLQLLQALQLHPLCRGPCQPWAA